MNLKLQNKTVLVTRGASGGWAVLCALLSCCCLTAQAQSKFLPANQVNVFLGSSGDHGQMSPAASVPFNMLSIGPQTYPHGHTGYEYKAKTFLGFTHNRFEGVGCEGSGGNLLVTPMAENNTPLIKATEAARPGYYAVSFTNGIQASFQVDELAGVEHYHFPAGKGAFSIDLSHTLANRFVREEHQLEAASLGGWIESGTTCDAGIYRVYYYLSFEQPVRLSENKPHVIGVKTQSAEVTIHIALSSVSIEDAKVKVKLHKNKQDLWNKELAHIQVSGDPEEEKLFYSLLYRTLQSPYVISSSSGEYRAIDGSLQQTDHPVYNGWSIWDNYKTQLPLLSLAYPERYQDIMTSLAGLYRFGKNNWGTRHEPSNTVRTEHAIVVLLDAFRKGYKTDFSPILDSLIRETDSLSFKHPDKALESCYDAWAMAQILEIQHKDSLSQIYLNRALRYKDIWNKDFKDLSKKDVDDLPARGMYQGTIWQYRWFVPYDIKGLMALCGGEKAYLEQLDTFFSQDYYNASNEPDIQVPYLFQGTSMPWKSQAVIHKYAKDTVVQYYYNDNSRGVDPFMDRVFKNQPDAYIRTMDDDGGAMSSWYILAACGLSPACVGWPVWYLHVPLFPTVTFNLPGGKTFRIRVKNFSKNKVYLKQAWLNGKTIDRNWLAHKEISAGGELIIEASEQPNPQFGATNSWMSSIGK